MKTFLVGFFLIFGLQANAATTMSTAEFIAHYVQKVNDRLETINTERALEGSRTYCAQLSDEQMSEIENLFVTNTTGKANQIVYRDLSHITAGQFIADASENLGCFPTSWLPGRSSIGGFFFGTKAYVMDNLLVRKSLEDLAGRPFDDSETLSQLLTR
ncbi:MAG: hypothetical protein JSU04_14960 [Bdellovibrionales bacterium]|nr:hypothetical protein [Bdellovibrionales bacterium]